MNKPLNLEWSSSVKFKYPSEIQVFYLSEFNFHIVAFWDKLKVLPV